jgi:broad specificity phosphatase PhoE
MFLYFIRHGQTDWNKIHRVMGETPVPLNEHGRAGIEAVGRALELEALRIIYTSTVARAFESASLLAKAWRAELREEKRLNESPFEGWVGQTYEDLRDDEQFRLYLSEPTRSRFSAREGIVDVQRRAMAAVQRILEEGAAPRVAVVSHSDVIKPVLVHCLGMGLDAMHRLSVANASVTLVDFSDGSPKLRYTNFTPLKWLAPL